MRAIAVTGLEAAARENLEHSEIVNIGGFPIAVGFVEIDRPSFDPEAPESRSYVLVEVLAFSCSYRDRALAVFGVSQSKSSVLHIGSDFIGKVLEVGRNVFDLKPDDRVIGDNHYPDAPARGIRPGIPTNHASARFLRLHESKLVKISGSMPIEVAAAFSVCAQTSYAILRRLQVKPGERGLVTAARSSTSLCILSGLEKYEAQVHALSTGPHANHELAPFGLSSTIRLKRPVEYVEGHELVKDLKQRTGGFDFIIDPFADVYFREVVGLLADGGRYVTCGLHKQMNAGGDDDFCAQLAPGFVQHFERIIVGNVSVIGNCLGLTTDLKSALADYATGTFDVVVDSIFHGNEAAEFLRRSFANSDRFGRVVFAYAN